MRKRITNAPIASSRNYDTAGAKAMRYAKRVAAAAVVASAMPAWYGLTYTVFGDIETVKTYEHYVRAVKAGMIRELEGFIVS